MSTEIEQATVSYKPICDKNGFCVVKIISQNNDLKLQEIKQIEQTVPQSQKSTVKLSSSRKNKKR
jgi:hypothetical protein